MAGVAIVSAGGTMVRVLMAPGVGSLGGLRRALVLPVLPVTWPGRVHVFVMPFVPPGVVFGHGFR